MDKIEDDVRNFQMLQYVSGSATRIIWHKTNK